MLPYFWRHATAICCPCRGPSLQEYRLVLFWTAHVVQAALLRDSDSRELRAYILYTMFATRTLRELKYASL